MKKIQTILLMFLAVAQGLAQQQPNIILINMDDMGVEEIAPYGNKIIKTPYLSQMAKEGLLFTRHYAGTSVCAPSRCALMTGKHTGHCEIRGNKQVEPHGQMPISEATVTVAELLKTAGYQTQLFGKWGLGCENTTGEPTRQGFDSYYGYLDQVLAHNNFPEYLMRNGKKEMLNNKVAWESPDKPFKGFGSFTPQPVVYSNDLFTKEALQYIDQPHKDPFFVYLAYTLPHNNGEAPHDQRFQSPTLKPYENEDWPELDKHYAATVSHMDKYVGQIMQKLREKGLDKNTLVFFTSDNGSTEDIPVRFAQSNKLRGYKRSPYEGGIRTPLIVWGGGVKAGLKTSVQAAHWDFLATACDIAGLNIPADTDGVSYLPTLKGKKQPKQRDFLYFEFHEAGKWQVLRQGNYKLVYHHKPNRCELYDLTKDPAEKNDIAVQQPKLVETLKVKLNTQHSPDPIWKF
jgi:arylsulfatase A